MNFEDILYEVRNGVAWITINRPDKMNAFRGTTKVASSNLAPATTKTAARSTS